MAFDHQLFTNEPPPQSPRRQRSSVFADYQWAARPSSSVLFLSTSKCRTSFCLWPQAVSTIPWTSMFSLGFSLVFVLRKWSFSLSNVVVISHSIKLIEAIVSGHIFFRDAKRELRPGLPFWWERAAFLVMLLSPVFSPLFLNFAYHFVCAAWLRLENLPETVRLKSSQIFKVSSSGPSAPQVVMKRSLKS